MEADLLRKQLRRRYFDLARQRARPGSGSHPLFLERRTAVKEWPDLSAIFRDIPWAVIGGVATRAYMPERLTQDLDVLVRAADAQASRAVLVQVGFTLIGELTIRGATWRAPEGWLLDVIETDAAWASEALARVERDPQGLPVLALPYFVLMKWEAGRLRDLADAQQMLGLADEEVLAATRGLFARYAPEALDDLEGLITLGKLEMGQPPEENRGGSEGLHN
jgi:hypothetical protein